MNLSPADKARLKQYLSDADDDEKNTALNSRNSFFDWLKKKGLKYIVDKFSDVSWDVIKAVVIATALSAIL